MEIEEPPHGSPDAPPSDTSPLQESGSHDTEAQASGEKPDNAETISQGPDGSGLDLDTAGGTACTADVDANMLAADNLISVEAEASEVVQFAISLLEEIKAELSLSDLETAIFLFRQVLSDRPTTHPLHTDALRDLALALGVRFMYTSQADDFKESTDIHTKILGTFNVDRQASHTQDSTFGNEDDADVENTLALAKILLTDFHKSTSLHVLNTIIFLIQHSMGHLPSRPAIQMAALTALVDALYARFAHNLGTWANDLNEAITRSGMAGSLQKDRKQSPLNCKMRVGVLSFARFQITGDLIELHGALQTTGAMDDTTITADLEEKIYIAGKLMQHCIPNCGDMTDLNCAVALWKEILTNVHHSNDIYSVVINNLGITLSTRFKQGGQQSDLDEAISLYRQAVNLRLPPHPGRSHSLNNLASALRTRFEQGGRQTDLDEAISLHRQALDLRPSPHPDRSVSLDNLALALDQSFQRCGEQVYFDESMSVFSAASQYPFQSPSHRLKVAKTWIGRVERTPHTSATHAYEAGLRALQQIAFLSLDLRSRHLALISD